MAAENLVVAVEAEAVETEAVEIKDVETCNPRSDRAGRIGRRIRHWVGIVWHWIWNHLHFSNIVIIAILFLMYIERSKTFSTEDLPFAYEGSKMILSLFDNGWKFLIYALKHLTHFEFGMFLNDCGNFFSEIFSAFNALMSAFV